jgi:hypothetical protein
MKSATAAAARGLRAAMSAAAAGSSRAAVVTRRYSFRLLLSPATCDPTTASNRRPLSMT